MTKAVLVRAAEAVTAALNDREELTPNLEFTAERSYADWELELSDPYLHVDVVPVGHANERGMKSELDTRGSFAYLPQVDIGIRKRFGVDEQTEDGRIVLGDIDDCALLLEQIGEYLTLRTIGAEDEFVWRETEYRACYVREALEDQRQYIGIVRITYEFSAVL